MFGFKRVALGLLVGGGGMYFADHYHVVHTTEGVVVVPRAQQPSLRSAYADVRGWDAAKWAQYPELSQSMVTDGRSGLLIDGTTDGLMRELGTKLMLPAAGSAPTGTMATDRPPIVFGQPAAPILPNTPQSTAPADDSLLGRLSRQLQGNSASTSPQFDTRPLQRDVPGAPAPPLQPAYSSPQTPPGNERADIDPPPFVDEDFPSIHSAAMQRVNTTLGAPAGTVESLFTPATGTHSTASGLIPQLQEAATNQVPELDWLQPRTSPSATPADASSDAGLRPLEIDAQRLQQQLPSVIQQNLIRTLQPSAAVPPPTGQAY